MSCAGAVATCSVWWLRTGAPRPLSAYGRRILVRFCSSGMLADNINRATVHRILRVDHAGEYGANRIYAGQMAVLGRSSVGPVIQVREPPCLGRRERWRVPWPWRSLLHVTTTTRSGH
ncbi:coenzyme Q7, hydroxylase [Rhinolophus ferrumequinum]|uniref:Coenzyme Q7, hydroxylase n=1 Tax=Rhinolophus ferrumequinum TaxID=59479 RepID=A0A7J7R868_RHIFE|nr:coenzyme Q7, hydroxylase [Rhinolophus ferrumequinum]